MTVHDLGRTSPCDVQSSGTIELFFYGELDAAAQARVTAHLPGCVPCREALEELRVIRDALAARPIVAAPASGDWSGFMARLGDAVARETHAPDIHRPVIRRSIAGYAAMAALLALVTMSVVYVARSRTPGSVPASPGSATLTPATAPPLTGPDAPESASIVSASGEHFERSKLVVLGLATKDARHVSAKDWTYERQMASDLLSDTRLYRMAAEDRGMNAVAGVMRDLELVLLQTSLTDTADPAALTQIQHLIQKRDLVEKMSVVATAGL